MISDMQSIAEDFQGRVKIIAIHGSEIYAKKLAAIDQQGVTPFVSIRGKSVWFVTQIN